MKAQVNHRSLAYNFIRSRIFEGEMIPGERVSDFVLAKEIGVSRTPVREAITQLATEGLIEHIPQFGSFVRKLSRKELAELFDLREMLESYAAEAAAGKIPPPLIGELRRLCRDMASLIEEIEEKGAGDLHGGLLKQQVKDDLSFHLHILRASECTHVQRVVSDLRILTNLFLLKRREPSGDALVHLRKVLREHLSIIDALEAGNGPLAASRMRGHLKRAKEVALAYYDKHADDHFLQHPETKEPDMNEVIRKIGIYRG